LLAQLDREADPCLVHPLPNGLKIGHYDDQGLRFDDLDRYGKPLTFTTSTDLRRLQLPADMAPWNQAVLGFLLAMPPDVRLFLYWC
jgi:hypothetical protein